MPVGSRFYITVQTILGTQPASCTVRTGSFTGVKRPGHCVDHIPPTSAEAKGSVELYLYFPSGSSCLF